MWKMRKFLTRKIDVQSIVCTLHTCKLSLKSRVFFSMHDVQTFSPVSHGFLSNFYFSKHPSKIVSTSFHVHAYFH